MNTNARPFSCWQPLLLCGLLYAGCHNGYHDEVIQNIRGHNAELSTCLQNALNANPNMRSGEIDLALKIDPSGRVIQTALAKDEVGDPGLADCLKSTPLNWQMPAPPDGKIHVEIYKVRAHGNR